MLWWMSRGYTPAGVEAWNGIRAIDYLLTRTEVDGSRIGVTGRSGGGAYSWWITALDERVGFQSLLRVLPVFVITSSMVVSRAIATACLWSTPVNGTLRKLPHW